MVREQLPNSEPERAIRSRTAKVYRRGHFRTLSNTPVSPRNHRDGCLGLLNTTYYFYLSFENSLCRDYVTEKFFKVVDNINVIPVVRGGTDYEQYFPPNTFINTADFESPQHLATHLKTLMTDTKRYGEMLRAKDNFLLKSARPGGDGMCDLCRRLHVPDIPEHVYLDFMDWTSTNMCWQPKDV